MRDEVQRSVGLPKAAEPRAALTLLGQHGETESQSLGAWSRDLHWVCGVLLRSVRRRCDCLHWQVPSDMNAAQLQRQWQVFLAQQWPIMVAQLRPLWRLAQARDLAGLMAADQALAFENGLSQRSLRAGHLAAQGSRGALHLGLLGRLREAIEQGQTPGHWLVVWAAIGSAYSMSWVALFGEALRLEWLMGTRSMPGAASEPPQWEQAVSAVAGLEGHELQALP